MCTDPKLLKARQPGSTASFLKPFQNDERGVVMIMFGLSAFVLFFFAGMAIDYTRTMSMKARISNAIDSAALAVGREMVNGKLSDSELITLGETYFNQNLGDAGWRANVGKPSIAVDRDSGKVNIDVTGNIAMTLTKIGGFNSFTVPVKNESVFKVKDVEVALALDLTGSMNRSIKGGSTRLTALKGSFKEFTKQLFPEQETSQKVRVALAPYSAGVRLGTFATNVVNKPDPSGCVAERVSGSASDNTGKFRVRADAPKGDIDPLDSSGSGIQVTCAPPSVTPLLDKKGALDDIVDDYTADGFTSGHLGAQWAWNLVSDKWGSTWGGDSVPDPYQRIKDDKLVKAIILMTDGDFNTAFSGKASSSQQAIDLCTAMKNEGVKVFSIGLAINAGSVAEKTLKACASPGTEYFYSVSDPKQLTGAFVSFAQTLTALRISK
jgi:Flp pilus assembly protein TadG